MPGIESQKAYDLMQERFPGAAADGATARVVFVAPGGRKVTAAAEKAAIEETVDALGQGSQVAGCRGSLRDEGRQQGRLHRVRHRHLQGEVLRGHRRRPDRAGEGGRPGPGRRTDRGGGRLRHGQRRRTRRRRRDHRHLGGGRRAAGHLRLVGRRRTATADRRTRRRREHVHDHAAGRRPRSVHQHRHPGDDAGSGGRHRLRALRGLPLPRRTGRGTLSGGGGGSRGRHGRVGGRLRGPDRGHRAGRSGGRRNSDADQDGPDRRSARSSSPWPSP